MNECNACMHQVLIHLSEVTESPVLTSECVFTTFFSCRRFWFTASHRAVVDLRLNRGQC